MGSLSNNLLTAQQNKETKVAMVDSWTKPSHTLKPTEWTLKQNTHMREEMENATLRSVMRRLPLTKMLLQRAQRLSEMLLLKDQFLLLSVLDPLDSNCTTVEFSRDSAEPTSITVSLPLDTELRKELTTGLSRTPGVPDG